MVGLFPGKAVVVIDGGAPRVLSVGQKPVEGVTLISTDRESATLVINGQKRTLRIGQHQAGPAPASANQSVTLTADPRGHFVVDGQVNGGAVRFLVDTTVRVGDILVNNVDGAVLEGTPMPFALLGMSFLNRMEMKREGQTMVLIRRF
ncbi:MAG: TIGR02281 family clan AA aspartic protease [Betaproteobacteria bacterium]|nr:MAG: TIGR02281 family clan AA aspartic protease [Betaproteobacteria bacterium]